MTWWRRHAGEPGAGTGGDGWVRERLLDPLVARLRRQGIDVTLGDDFVSWVVAHAPHDLASAETFLDRDLAPRLVATAPVSGSPMRAVVRDGEPVAGARGARLTGRGLVEMRGLEPLSPAMRTRCSPS